MEIDRGYIFPQLLQTLETNCWISDFKSVSWRFKRKTNSSCILQITRIHIYTRILGLEIESSHKGIYTILYIPQHSPSRWSIDINHFQLVRNVVNLTRLDCENVSLSLSSLHTIFYWQTFVLVSNMMPTNINLLSQQTQDQKL